MNNPIQKIRQQALKRGISKTVYSCVWSETKSVVEGMWSECPHHLYENAPYGAQDNMHEEFMEESFRWLSMFMGINNIDHQTGFPYSYPTNGSSEAIREVIALHKSKHPDMKIHILHGEYEGYEAYAKGYGIPVVKHNLIDITHNNVYILENIDENGHDLFFISNPNSINGEFLKNFNDLCYSLHALRPRCQVMLDVAYLGLQRVPEFFDTDCPNISCIFYSLSKSFGVYYHRIGGVFSKFEIPGFRGNVWFKNVFNLCLGANLLRYFGTSPTQIVEKYQDIQEELVNNLSYLGNVRASNTILLAYKNFNQSECKTYNSLTDLEKWLYRGDTVGRLKGIVRYCLTEGFNQAIRKETTS